MGMFTLLPDAIQVNEPDDALAVVSKLSDCKVLAVDTETTGLSRTRDYAIIIAVSDGESRWAIFPEVIPYFRELLENPELKLIMHNANFAPEVDLGLQLNSDSEEDEQEPSYCPGSPLPAPLSP